jgi:hypothetical protein
MDFLDRIKALAARVVRRSAGSTAERRGGAGGIHPSRSAPSEKMPDQIESAIANLIRQRTLQEAVGERPETMLIPHIRIKLSVFLTFLSCG